MAVADDIAKIIEQERELVFDSFDEATAFALGSRLRERAIADKLPIVIDVRLWDRPLFYCAMPGSTGDNPHWVRRKANTVQRLLKSSYRVVLEKSWEGDVFPPRRGLDANDFVLAGGGFAIRVRSVGPIGVITVSGLHERDDHQVVIDAVCDHLGRDKKDFALSPK